MQRTPLRPQFQTTECGVGVLASILAWFGRPVSMREIRRVSGVSRDALDAAAIRRTARAFGLACSARSVEPEALDAMGLPVVVHMRFIHFVIVESIDAATVRINCPHAGRLDMPRARFNEDFTGIALRMTPGPGFRAEPATEPSEAAWAWTLARGASAWLVPALGGALLAAACAVLFAHALADLSGPARAGLAGVAGAGWLAHWGQAGLRAALYERMRARLVAHLTALPDAFYVYRLPEVLFAVAASLRTLSDGVARQVAPAAGALLAGAVLLGGATWCDARLGAGFAAATALWGLGVAALCHWRRHVGGMATDPADADAGADALIHPEAIRLAEGADGLRRSFAAGEANRLLARVRLGAVLAMAQAAPLVLTGTCLLVVMALGSGLTPAQSRGWAALAVALGFILGPLPRLRRVFASLRQQAFRLRDVLDEPFEAEAPAPPDAPRAGEVRAEALSYAFTPLKAPVVRDVTLHVAPGEQLGLTGPSGGGKSTLAALIAGRLRPTGGAVRAGGRVLRVDRTTVFFAATVRENLTLWDPAVTEADLAAAVRDACLDDVLADRPGGLEAPVAPFGRNFSGGQLQRLEIARALARNPAVLILDDAVDALDLATELRLRAALRRRGCTVLLISHRASSLAACDRILRFAAGQLRDVAAEPRARRAVGLSVFDRPTGVPGAQPVGAAAKALAAAFAAVVPGDGALPEIAGLSRAAALACLAEARGRVVRDIRVTEPGWWRYDTGPLLGFRPDGAPVAVLSHSGGAVALDPVTGARTRLEAAALGPLFHEFEPVRQLGSPGLAGWVRPVLRAGVPDTAWAAACTAMAGAAAVLVPLVMATPRAGAALPLLAALAVFWGLREAALRRMAAAMRRVAAALRADLLLRADASEVRAMDYAQAWQATHGIERLTERVIEIAGAGVGAGLLLAAALIALACTAGLSALVGSLAAVLLCGAIEVAGPLANASGDAKRGARRLEARRWLAGLLWGFSRLRGLGATQAAFAQWLEADAAYEGIETRASRILGLAASLRLPGLLLAVLPAGLAGGAAAAALGWLAARSSARMGVIIGDAVADQTGRRAARALLNVPRDSGRFVIDAATAVILAERVTCRYPGTQRPVFTELSLSVDPASVTVLAGPSGGGKSTLLRLLLGLQRPEAGSIRIGAHPIGDIDLARWHRRIAGVFQGDQLEHTSTIRGQFPAGQANTVADIWDALDVVELSDEVRAMPMALQTIVQPGVISSGQQQRLLIARALLHSPALLVMDEATNAIQDDLQGRILGRLRARGTGCLIVSHRETVIQAADCVHVIMNGAVAYSGPPGGLAGRADLNAVLREADAA